MHPSLNQRPLTLTRDVPEKAPLLKVSKSRMTSTASAGKTTIEIGPEHLK